LLEINLTNGLAQRSYKYIDWLSFGLGN
jgi:hypothetical protein